MLLYDDTAAEALHAAADEARHRGYDKYDTAHVLLGLLRTADPVTRTVTAELPQLTVEAIGAPLRTAPRQPSEEDSPTARGRRSPLEPSVEFRNASRRFTARWRPLVRERRLRPGLKLGTGELWLTVLEPATASASVLAALGVEPDEVRPLVLATMVPDGAPVPDWPTEIPAGAVRRLLARVRGAAAGR